jgi:phosphonate transport system substrate-binding protein
MHRAKTVIGILALFACTLATAETFTFTAIPDQNESRLVSRFGKVADYLEQRLDTDVKYVPVKSYAAAVTAFRNNEVQMAWFGGLSGVQARRLVPDSRAIAQGAEDREFRTYFIAHEKAGLKPGEDFPEQIAGKTFTFGSKGSTSGRLMPEFYIRKNLDGAPGEVFERVGFSGDHSRTIALVDSGAYAVGAVNFKVWQTAVEEGKVNTDRVKVIWKTPPYPDYHWVMRGDADERLGSGFTSRVRDILLNLDDRAILEAFPRSAFVPASNSDYQPIRRTAHKIGLLDE